MKFQSVELEFVTFDAQDVIATSGDPWVGFNMYALQSTLISYNTANSSLIQFQIGDTPANDGQYTGFKTTCSTEDNYYHWSSQSVEDEFNPTKYKFAESTADIVAWLTANNIKTELSLG